MRSASVLKKDEQGYWSRLYVECINSRGIHAIDASQPRVHVVPPFSPLATGAQTMIIKQIVIEVECALPSEIQVC